MAEYTWNLHVSHRGQSLDVALPSDSTVHDLQLRLEDLTGVLPTNQKLLYKSKKAAAKDYSTLLDAGLKDGANITMLGVTQEEVGGLQKEESEHRQRERILQKRAAQGTVKVRRQNCSFCSVHTA
jgi:hypothetical protein